MGSTSCVLEKHQWQNSLFHYYRFVVIKSIIYRLTNFARLYNIEFHMFS